MAHTNSVVYLWYVVPNGYIVICIFNFTMSVHTTNFQLMYTNESDCRCAHIVLNIQS